MKKIILVSATALLSFSCFSQTQGQMNEQTKKDYKKADEIMAVTYRNAMANEDEFGKKLLLEAQRAWINYKEAHCKSESNQFEGGSMQPLIYFSCLTELTNERTKKLKAYTEE